jgi:signal transduction histidine kinase/ligand-binding sensor domain-containing protein
MAMSHAATKGSKAGFVRAFSLLSIFIFLFPAWMSALDPHSRISQYGHTSWKIQDGYFGGEPVSIAQTTDGYIWIATHNGVFRFDGVKFTEWKPSGDQFPEGRAVYYLLGSRDGSLWLGTGRGLSRFKAGRLTYYKTTPVSPGIGGIFEDHTGKVWVTRYLVNDGMGPLCWAKESTLECYGKKDGLPANYGLSLAEDGAGNLWFGCERLCRWEHGSSTTYFDEQLEHPAGEGVEDVAATASGEVWASFGGTGPKVGVQHFVNGRWSSYIVPGLDGRTIRDAVLFVDKSQTLWIGTESNGLYHVHDGFADHYGVADGLTSNNINAFYEDMERNIWVATTQGLDEFRDKAVTSFSSTEGLSGGDSRAVLAVNGDSVWVGGQGGLDVLHAGPYSSIRHQAMPGKEVMSVFADSKRQIWLGIDDKIFVYRQEQYIEARKSDGSALGPIGNGVAFTEDRDGDIWVLTGTIVAGQQFLLDFRDQRLQKKIPLSNRGTSFLAADRRAGIWSLADNGELSHYVKGRVAESAKIDNVSKVFGLDVDPNNAVLASAGVGLYRWSDGKGAMLSVKNGLPCSGFQSVIEGDQGSHWLRTVCGILRISAEEWQKWLKSPDSKISFTLFDSLDGAQAGTLQTQPAITKTENGRIWFAAGSTVQMVDPSRSSNPYPPPVHIEKITADHKSYEDLEKLKLPPLKGELQIDYTALSFKIPQRVGFRYKLEGHDEDWQDAGTRRQAFYNDLPPKQYRFRVIACNNDGVWNETGASLDFSILPAYYQTAWFRALCLAAFLLLLWLLYQYRLGQLQHQFNIGLEAQVNERTRIARELHDTLLQSFQGAAFQFQAARKLLLRNAGNAMHVVDEAIEAAEEGITEGRAAIRDLRPDPAGQRNLPDLLKAAGQELSAALELNGQVPSYQVLVEGEQQDLSPMLQGEVYRISREVIRNAFAHAFASHIEVEIRYDQDQLRVRVRDDGKGIAPKILKTGGASGHFGIPGMRERAHHIGSRLDFWSEMGAGTEVQLTVPAAMVYEKRRHSRKFRLFRKTGGDE